MRAANDRLAALYRLHALSATRLAYTLTGDRDVAEDLVHEAFVRMGGKVLTLRDLDHARAYLFRTVINLSRGRGRKLQRESRAILQLQPPPPPEPVPTLADDVIWSSLLDLPVRQRAALFFRYYEELTEREAADAMNCSLSALKSLVNRGLRELRIRLKEAIDE